MKGSEMLLDVIGEIDGSFIPELSPKKYKNGVGTAIKLSGIAAVCAAAAFIGMFIIPPKGKNVRYDSFALSRELPVNYGEACFVINVNEPREQAGWSDYVFAARVDEELRTEYENVRRNEKGVVIGSPYTYYSVTVIDNLKGELKKNEPIELCKKGGVSYDGKSISLIEGDSFLEAGKYYIIFASAEKDGRLGQGGMPNTAVELDISDADELESCDKFIEYKSIVQNEIPYDRERFHSVYEESVS